MDLLNILKNVNEEYEWLDKNDHSQYKRMQRLSNLECRIIKRLTGYSCTQELVDRYREYNQYLQRDELNQDEIDLMDWWDTVLWFDGVRWNENTVL